MRYLLPVLLCACPLIRDLAAQQFQFMPFTTRAPSSFLPGTSPISGGFATRDVDGDGRRDVVVSAGTGGQLLLGTATGWTSVVLPSLLNSHRPSLHDLDGDGDLDIVFGPALASLPRPIVVMRKDAGGVTNVVLPAPTSTTNVQGVVAGDVDGDGDMDLVVATIAGTNAPALVLLRNGGGLQFAFDVPAMPAGLPYGLWPRLLDFDLDGDLDVIASTAAGGFVLLRNVGGTFVDARSILPPTRLGHTFLATGDLDGDGFEDAAAMWWNGDLDVLWGNGATFAFQASVVAGVGARSLWPVDLDGDGDLDLVAERSGGMDVLRNMGARQFVAEPSIGEPVSAFGLDDFDGDGAADILFTTVATRAWVRCRFAGEPGAEDAGFALGFRVPQSGLAGFAPMVGDVDGDQRTDVLVASNTGLVVDHARGDGVYRMTISPPLASTSLAERSALADLDADGDLDLVLATDVDLRAYENDGTGTFVTRWVDGSTGSAIDDLRVADIDGDGDVDIVRLADTGAILLRNFGGWSFGPPVLLAAAVAPAPCLELVDVDGDGDIDIVTGILLVSPVGRHLILANDGAGNFAPNAGLGVDLGQNPQSIRAVDFDGDGDFDLVIASAPPRLLQNHGVGVFTDVSLTHLPTVSATIISNIVVADFDADGDADLFAMTSSAVSPGLMLVNDGTGHFLNVSASRMQVPVQQALRWGVTAADFDDDGDLDLLLGNPGAILPGQPQVVLANHLRQLRSNVAPRLGAVAQFDVFTGPGFGPSGLALVGMAFGFAPMPLQVPGFDGRMQLDPASLQFVATLPTSSAGVSNVLLPVPISLQLAGIEVWLQAAVLPFVGTPGLTNAVYEVVLR